MLPLANLDRKGSTEKISLTYIEEAEMQVQEGFEPEDTESIRTAECFRGKAPLAGDEIRPSQVNERCTAAGSHLLQPDTGYCVSFLSENVAKINYRIAVILTHY